MYRCETADVTARLTGTPLTGTPLAGTPLAGARPNSDERQQA